MIETTKGGNMYVTCDITGNKKRIEDKNDLPKEWFEVEVYNRYSRVGTEKLHACNGLCFMYLLFDNKEGIDPKTVTLDKVLFSDLLEALEKDIKNIKVGIVPSYIEDQNIVAADSGIDSIATSQISETLQQLIDRDGCLQVLNSLEGLLN